MQELAPATAHPELPRSLTDTIADWIIGRMMRGDLRPGQALNIDALSRQFGVSQTPIREAIRTLQAERVVDYPYRRSPRIAPLDRKIVQDLYCCRIYVLHLTARLAMEKLTEDHISRVHSIIEQMRHTVVEKDTDTYFRLSIAFGDLLAEAAGNSVLSDIVSLLRRRSLLLRYLSLQSEGRLEAGLQYHESMLQALTQADGQQLEVLISEHLLEARDICLMVLADSL